MKKKKEKEKQWVKKNFDSKRKRRQTDETKKKNKKREKEKQKKKEKSINWNEIHDCSLPLWYTQTWIIIIHIGHNENLNIKPGVSLPWLLIFFPLHPHRSEQETFLDTFG